MSSRLWAVKTGRCVDLDAHVSTATILRGMAAPGARLKHPPSGEVKAMTTSSKTRREDESQLVFPTAESHSQQAVLLSITEQQIAEAHGAAVEAAQGASNDDEIERLWELVEVLMGALQIEGEFRL